MIDETSGCQPTHVKAVGYGAVPTRNIVTVCAQHLASGHRVDKIDELDLVEIKMIPKPLQGMQAWELGTVVSTS